MCKGRFLFLLILHFTFHNVSVGQNIDSLENTKILTQAQSFYAKGIDYGGSGILDSALLYTKNAILLLEGLQRKDITLLANAYQSIGIINKLLGKYDDAINYYNKAEIIYKRRSNNKLLPYIYGNKANIYFTQQDYSKSIDYQVKANLIFRSDSLRYINQLSISYNNLGNIYKILDENDKSIIYYKKSLNVRAERRYTYRAIGNLAQCYDKLGEDKIANKYFLEVIDIINELFGKNNIKVTTHYLNYANFLAKQNKSIEALQLFHSTINIYKNTIGEKHPNLSNCFNNLGEFFLKENNLDSALTYFQKSLVAISPNFNSIEINLNPNPTEPLSKIGLLSALKNKAFALSKLYNISKNEEHLKLSVETYDIAIETINKIRSGYLSEESKLFLADNEYETFSSALHTCYELYELTGEQIYLNKAFNYNEGSKSAILIESLKNNQALNIGGITDSLIIKDRLIRKSIWSYEELIYEENKNKSPNQVKLNYWNNFLFEKKQELDDLTNYLDNNFNRYQSLKNERNTVAINDIQNKLSKNELLIEYHTTNNKIYTFVIGKKSSEIYLQNIDSIFHNHLDILLKSLSNNNFSYHGIKDFNQFQESSFYLYNYLLKPFDKKIENKDLIIIPSGKLTYLPFEILISEKRNFDRINYNALPYSLYNNSFNYFYSATLLLEKNQKSKTASKKIGAFAPSYENVKAPSINQYAFRQEYREKLYPLKGIKKEVQQISQLIKGDKFLDSSASEKTFKKVAPLYDILHLAMHTIMDDENPMYSKMAFSQNTDSTEDGFLNTHELYNMKLNSRMAVLSSCNSGSGKFQRGEGVMSLARGFVYAGCPSIVMTLWTVEDKSGVELMSSFYKYLLKGKTKSESLQLSKIDFINSADPLKSHPYFWSGYIVIGNNDALFKPYIKYLIVFGILFVAVFGIFVFRKRRFN